MTMRNERRLIHAGGWMNARVYRVEDADGGAFVEKDFSESPWIARQTIGRFLVWRECWVLRRLAGTGVVPGGVRRLSPFSLREAFVAGFALRDSDTGVYASNVFDPSKVRGVPTEMLREPVPASFFDALEEGVRAVHAAGFVHLDLHNARNVMVGPGWRPVLVDWQSALPTRWMPGPVRRALERIDLAGVYKFRNKFHPGDLSPEQTRFLERRRTIRRLFWLPRIHLAARCGGSAEAAPAVEAGVSLGSNLGNRARNLRRAVRMLAETPGVRLLACSSLYETEPVDVPPEFAGRDYLNAAAVFGVSLPLDEWSHRCHSVEKALGRVRTGYHHPRTIDVDLLWFGDVVRDGPGLRLPHPQISSRRFVCEPLAEIRPDLRLPGLPGTVSDLLAALPPRPGVRRLEGSQDFP